MDNRFSSMQEPSTNTATSVECVATIKLPAGLSRIPLLQIPQLIASALYPQEDQASDKEKAERWALNEVLLHAAAGILPMRNPYTLGEIEPDHNESGLLADSVVAHTVITVADLRAYVARRNFSVEIGVDLPRVITDTRNAESAAPEVNNLLLASPAELLDAFNAWGLRKEWFAELHSHQWLLDARKKVGRGQRGHRIEPLFCPYLVMSGLMHKVRKAKRLQPDTAWRVLEHKFPRVFSEFESHDPRERTGD